MSITASQVKELREKTGVGMMECKKALEENSGDIEKAILWLRERGMSRAAKKADRVAAEGLVEVFVNDDQNAGVVLEINCDCPRIQLEHVRLTPIIGLLWVALVVHSLQLVH